MNVAEWILVSILSLTLLIFLIVATILCIRLISLTDQAKKVVSTSQSIADKTDDIVGNVKEMTSVGGVVKQFVKKQLNTNKVVKKGGKNDSKTSEKN